MLAMGENNPACLSSSSIQIFRHQTRRQHEEIYLIHPDGCFSASAILVAPAAHSDEEGIRHYAMTITNITHGQILAPPAVIAHNGDYKLFTLRTPSSTELAILAEEGNPSPLLDSVASILSLYPTARDTGGIMPSASMTIEIETTSKFPEISVASMLVSTHDGFMAVRGILAPRRGGLTTEADAYDAGSEANTENCAFIPGPPCGSHVHDPAPAEGYVYVHSGVHGMVGAA